MHSHQRGVREDVGQAGYPESRRNEFFGFEVSFELVEGRIGRCVADREELDGGGVEERRTGSWVRESWAEVGRTRGVLRCLMGRDASEAVGVAESVLLRLDLKI